MGLSSRILEPLVLPRNISHLVEVRRLWEDRRNRPDDREVRPRRTEEDSRRLLEVRHRGSPQASSPPLLGGRRPSLWNASENDRGVPVRSTPGVGRPWEGHGGSPHCELKEIYS